jgi:hypothetical protein
LKSQIVNFGVLIVTYATRVVPAANNPNNNFHEKDMVLLVNHPPNGFGIECPNYAGY